MRVVVIGPNLRDQRQGQFHVHAEGCADIAKYGLGRPLGGDVSSLIDIAHRLDAEEFIYGDFENHPPGDSLCEFHFAPCCEKLPVGPLYTGGRGRKKLLPGGKA